MVLVVSVYALRQPSQKGEQAGSTTAKPTPAKTSPRTSATATRSSTPPAASGKLPLVVLNDTKTPKLAAQAQSRFVAGGWQVTSIGNLQDDIVSTCAYFDPDTAGAPEAAQALTQQFPAIKRTAPKFAGLPAGPIVVVLTPDYVSG